MLGLVTTLFVVTLLVVTNVWNPLPTLAAWWNRLNALSTPGPLWVHRLGGPPERIAVMSGGQAVAAIDGTVYIYNAETGAPVGEPIKAFWGLPALDVVVLRQQGTNPDHIGSPDTGYDVVSAATGKVIWGARDAQAVWAFDDKIMDLVCDSSACKLRVYNHISSDVLYTVALPVAAHTMHGPDPGLVSARDPASWFDKARGGSPGPLPRVIGLKIDSQIYVIDLATRTVRPPIVPDLQTWVSLTGLTIVETSATPDGTGCHYSVRGFSGLTGEPTFPSMDVDVGTVDGVACAQHRDPIGNAGWLVAKDPRTNDPLLIEAGTGDIRWRGEPSERVLDTDGQIAAILTADRHTVEIIDLQMKPVRVVWTGHFGLDPQAAITSRNVLIRDGDNDQLLVLDHNVTQHTQVKTRSEVVGVGPSGVVLASGNRIGVIPVPS